MTETLSKAQQRPHGVPTVSLAKIAGQRTCDITRLRWGDVDITNGLIRIRRLKKKSGVRPIPLHQQPG
jgi:integrase